MDESELRQHWRSPFLAGLLNVLFPPLGHVYAGRAGRGIGLFIAFAVIVAVALYFAVQPVGVAGLLLCLLLIVAGGVWLIADAALVARRQGSRFRLRRYNRWYVYPWQDNRPAERVPEGHLFVMGDNRDNSSDSRSWGTVPRDHVSGVFRTVYFPWDRASSRVR